MMAFLYSHLAYNRARKLLEEGGLNEYVGQEITELNI